MAQGLRERKQSARRKLAAFNFLSNISLDGTHKDTRLSIFTQKGSKSILHKNLKTKVRAKEGGNSHRLKPISDQESQLTVSSFPSSSVFSTKTGDSSCGSGIFQSAFHKDCLSPINNAFFQRSISLNTTSSGDGPKNLLVSENVPALTVHRDDDGSSASSTNILLSKRTRKESEYSDIFDVQHEIKVVDKSKLKNLRLGNERLVLLSKTKAPVAVFSTLPFTLTRSQTSMTGVFTKLGTEVVEGVTGRLRKPSGRHSANVDLILEGGLLGHEPIDETQEVSYCQYLTPTRYGSDTCDGHYASFDNVYDSSPASPHSPFLRSISFDPSLLYHRTPATPNIREREFDFTNVYHANLLDDPELMSGKHRKQNAFTSYLTSVIQYVKPADLKRDLNEQFKEKFPNIQLTLSKLRSLKRDIKKLLHVKCGVDLWSVATAYVFFEKLVLKGLITKCNRKLVCGACVLLAGKLNDIGRSSDIHRLVEEIEDMFRLHKKDLFAYEFVVLVALEFSLHLLDDEVYPHYQRLTSPS